MQAEILCDHLQNTEVPVVLVLAGGGSTVLPPLLARGGGSRVLLACHIPYHPKSLTSYLQLKKPLVKTCSQETGLALSMRAFLEGYGWTASEKMIGLSLTCVLPRRGTEREGREHRIFCSYQTESCTVIFGLHLAPGHSREDAELLTRNLVLNTWSEACGLPHRLPLPLKEKDVLDRKIAVAEPALQAVLLGTSLAHPLVGSGEKPTVLFSSACNPFHQGHQRMIELAAQLTGKPVSLEIPLLNADKPPVDYLSLQERVESIRRLMEPKSLWVTGMRTFVEKARHWGGDLQFIVGTDTAMRICEPRFYGGEAGLAAALQELRTLRCRFLCFARGEEGSYPPAFREIAEFVPKATFWDPVSSTQLRGEGD